jgi:anthranilate/para-aminobenzoate synthase component I
MVERELAGVTHLVSTVEGALRGRTSARRAARGDVPGRLGHRRAEDRAVDLIAALEPVGRGASMGALGDVRGTATSSSR